jgi:predicted Zn-dependent protease
MMRFVEDDLELSLVISHELAHNVMNHVGAKKKNLILGTLLDIIAAGLGVNTQGVFGTLGVQAYSKEFEEEADYVGLYIMALSGLDIENAPNFWRRMAAVHSDSISYATTHPSTPHRFVLLEKTVQEINQKITSDVPLKPELKKESTTDGSDTEE